VDTKELVSISFIPNGMEFLISFILDDVSEDIVENNDELETLNLGQAQKLMGIFHVKDSLKDIAATSGITLIVPITIFCLIAILWCYDPFSYYSKHPP
jgi:hypothetical protein